MRNPTPIFHITAIDNLAQIFGMGELRAKNSLSEAGFGYQNIAYQTIQHRRAAKMVSAGPGGSLHDYVPFYFAPRSPMLFTINEGNVPGCAYRQKDIVHFATYAQRIVDAGRRIVFYDRNASLDYSIPCDDMDQLATHVAWDLFYEQPTIGGYCRYWKSVSGHARYSERMEKRMAELLVHQSVPLDLCVCLGVFDNAAQVRVSKLLRNEGLNMKVAITPDWYY
jgi:hypothetical protein